VGTFKDEAWANSAVEKLNQLGYHAVCVHKGLLWVQSYHVQVGPYTDRKEMEAARSRLATQGFKTRAVK
jgi:cell division septation protein DedD